MHRQSITILIHNSDARSGRLVIILEFVLSYGQVIYTSDSDKNGFNFVENKLFIQEAQLIILIVLDVAVHHGFVQMCF